jgi:heme-degrading monooxygenase HmoA
MSETHSTIVRTWTATATPDGAERYRRYFADTLLPKLNDLAGFGGAYLLSRELNADDGSVELTTHTFWASEAAIRSFAGPDITASSVEPEARAFLLSFDATVTHRHLWIDSRG